MTDKHLHPQNKSQEERLAEFTDQVLSNGSSQTDSTEDPELARLEETVLRLKSTLEADQPDPALQQRVKNRTRVAWQGELKKSRSQKARPSLLEQLRRVFNSIGQRPALQWVLVAAVVLLVISLGLPSLSGGLEATALNGNLGLWVVLFVVVIGIGLYLWLTRK